ncbi:MAG: DUF6062 family protein [Candidatus Sumerlaeia bacterium]
MNDKHLPHFVVLEAIQHTHDRCFLCVLEDKVLRDNFETMLYESVNDGILRARLLHSRGYCPRHARILLECRKIFGTAILYLDQLRIFREEVAKSRPGARIRPPRDSALVNPADHCPACLLQAESRERYIQTFIKGLDEKDIPAAFEAAGQICTPHFYPLLNAIKNKTHRAWLKQLVEEKYQNIENHLAEYRRKMDYRNEDEAISPDEEKAPRMAVELMTGLPGIF